MKTNKILFVDDEEVVRKLGRRLLGGTYEFLSAAGMREALEIISANQLDLLIADWHLPDGDGVDVIRAFKGKFPGAPCILITGYLATEEFLEKAAGLELAARFQKPFEVAEFLEAVRRALADRADAADKK
ncbi:MAG: response regulator [Elusimicrobiota bacterium]